MARRFRFRQVDVFTDTPLHGNPLAVFPDARRLSDAEMQALAREMNLSETCFVLPPTEAGRAAGADYRLRIFTPGVELPFAGHPSIGAAWVLADEGRLPLHAPRTTAHAELAIGVLRISISVDAASAAAGKPGAGTAVKSRAGAAAAKPGAAKGAGARPGGKLSPGEVTMTQGRPDVQQTMEDDEVDELCEALEVARSAIGWPKADGGRRRHMAPAVVSTGLPHLIVPFVERAVMMDVDPERREHVAEICSSYGCDSAALVAPGNSGTIADADVCVRVLDAGTFKIDADPATGAAAGPIAVFLGSANGAHGTYRVVIEQGVEVGRPSRLAAEADFGSSGRAEEVRVSGRVVPVIEGWVTLP